MKKSKKIFLTILPVFMILAVMFVTFTPAVMAEGVNTEFPNTGSGIKKVEDIGERVWSTVVFVVRILAFAAIVFAGVRYMFASADQKADIKKGLVFLVIGAVLVFASTFLVDLVTTITNQVSGSGT